MKVSKILAYIIGLSNIPLIILGQDTNCYIDVNDTAKCYYLLKYTKPPIILEKKWESTEIASTRQVPLVADMDGDCIPEILLRGINQLDGTIIDTQRVHFFDGRNGSLKTKFDCNGFQNYNLSPVIADVDNDGIKEIIFSSSYGSSTYPAGFIWCYEFSGKLKWSSDAYYYNGNYDPGAPSFGVADFNQDGWTEVYCNNRIFNGQTGKLLAEGGINGVGSNFDGAATNSVSVAAQLDNDSNDLELAAGFSVYKVNIINLKGIAGNLMTPINIKVDNGYFDGKTGVADINGDGQLDVIVAYGDIDVKSKLYAYTLNNGVPALIAQNYIPGVNGTNSCPSIADIDGNGIPNILVSKTTSIHNFEFDGTNRLNLKWSLRVRDTFAFTGITTFDLNGDGIQEIIYRDHFNLLVIDGSVNPPQIIDSVKCIAGTFQEYPIIADIDNSGKSQICVVCGGASQSPRSFGYLTAFGSPDTLPGWAPSRGVWNQYAYNPLFINDDLTVPRVIKNHATYNNGKYNNFLQQASLLDSNGMYKVAAANLWGKINCVNYDPFVDEYTVAFDVFNSKDASSLAELNLPVSFYNGDPSVSGNLLGIFYSIVPLNPGDSLVDQQFKFKASQIKDLYMVVNTSRNANGIFEPKDFSVLECDYTDNYFHTSEFPKTEKISVSICNGSQYRFYDTILTVQGSYVHTLYNEKACDSLITILNLTMVDTVSSLQTLTVCDSFNWQGTVYRENGTFINHFQAASGCDSIVTLNLTIRESSDTVIQITACRKFGFNDKVYTEGGTYYIKLRNRQGCDSLIELDLNIIALDTNITKLGNTLIALDSIASYQWVDCNDNFAVIPGATEKIYKPNKDGSYAVITTISPCIDTSFCLPIIISSTTNNQKQSVLIYPNPATGRLFVQFLNPVSGKIILMIRDIHGRSVIKKVLAEGEKKVIDVDVSGLVGGLYYLYIQSEFGAHQIIFSKM
ncbi:MAG: VCBS repeat-containing protein [Saprospiraceae bacterium]|nr:VCBS repeat-containing protein [Saprospiraceae bacterium]MBK7738580.1 VCBS repeat-containing protein [Saprospiraceae bacterium]MBK7912848.1 VCBS repeat-containing protein [Saprospiraceae bacterium]